MEENPRLSSKTRKAECSKGGGTVENTITSYDDGVNAAGGADGSYTNNGGDVTTNDGSESGSGFGTGGGMNGGGSRGGAGKMAGGTGGLSGETAS